MTYLTRVLCIAFVFCLGLSACSDDSGSAQAPAAPAASSAAAPAAESSDSGLSSALDGVEKADGVVYQDEIYANWPYN